MTYDKSEPFAMGRGEAMLETDGAILVRFEEDDFGKEVWIPKSVVHDDSEVYGRKHTGKVVVLTWWAEKKGWA